MAGRLLLVVLLCFFIETRAQALVSPKLTVNPPVISETDSVTLNCQTPSSVSVSQCHFELGREKKNTKVFSCMKTLTGKELLFMSHQSSPAEVKMGCFYVVKVRDLDSPSPHSNTSSIFIYRQKPQMSLQHFQGEHILFICSLPGAADHETRCNLYFGESSHPVQTTTIMGIRTSTNQWICQFTVTIDDLLSRPRSVQQSDASCDYSSRSGPNSLSPRSYGYNLTGIVEKESSMITTKSPFAVTTDQTLHETETSLSPVTPPNPAPGLTVSTRHVTPETPTKQTSDLTVSSPGGSTFVSPVTPSTDIEEEESRTTQTVMTFTMTTVLTVSTALVPTPETPTKQTSVDQTHIRQRVPSIKASLSPNPAPETKLWKWKIWVLVIVVAGFGVIVGVTFVGVTLLCTKRRTERHSDQRTQSDVTDDVTCMQSLDHGGLLPAENDGAYSVITSVPGADFPAASMKLDRQRSQNEDSDIYHVYASIPEESASSALYSTVQAH